MDQAMKSTLTDKLLQIQDRFEELGALLSDADIIANQDKFRAFSKEYAELEPVVSTYTQYQLAETELEESQLLAEDKDPDIRDMAKEESKALEKMLVDLRRHHAREVLVVLADTLIPVGDGVGVGGVVVVVCPIRGFSRPSLDPARRAPVGLGRGCPVKRSGSR